MLRFTAAVLFILLALTAAFVFVPVAPVDDTRVVETIYAAPAQTRAYFEAASQPGLLPPTPARAPLPDQAEEVSPKVVTARKSNFRKAVEGRLKWLGVTDEIVVSRSCVTDAEGNRVCRRFL